MKNVLMASLFVILAACTQAETQTIETPIEPLEAGALSIHVNAASQGEVWSVQYRTGDLIDRLIFPRSAGDYRRDTWMLPDEFELVRDNHIDTIQRKDGASFNAVSAEFIPYDNIIHGEYTPFLSFTDGSMVVFTGQFSLGHRPYSVDTQNTDDIYAGAVRFDSVSLSLDPGPFDRFIAQGDVQSESVTYDNDAGEFVYLGDGVIEQTSSMDMIFDPDTPAWIRDTITQTMGPLSAFYQNELYERQIRPLMITTVGVLENGQYSMKGDVIANQLVMSLEFEPDYATQEQMGARLQALFAHEVAHLWQRGRRGFGWSSWIHEGGAEAISRLGLEASGLTTSEDTQAFFDAMIESCSAMLEDGPYQTAHARGHSFAGYQCGAVVHLATDHALTSAGGDGLIAFMRSLMNRDGWDGVNTWRMYLDALSVAGLQSYSDTLEGFLTSEDNAPDVQALLASAGYVSE